MPSNLNRPVTHEERQWGNAVSKARRNFGYFWREVYWDSQRQESKCEFAAVLFEFSEERNGRLVSERVWLGEIWCDGIGLHGRVMSPPQLLLKTRLGDYSKVPMGGVEDWVYVLKGKAYGAYTVNLQRSRMLPHERKRHDLQWGYDFGDPLKILRYPDLKPPKEVVEEEEPEKEPAKFFGMTIQPRGKNNKGEDEAIVDVKQRFDHPLALQMEEGFRQYYAADPASLLLLDERGLAPIHIHALAGNRHIVRHLIDIGVPATLPTHDGRTPKELAKSMHWMEVAVMLASAERGQWPPPERPARVEAEA